MVVVFGCGDGVPLRRRLRVADGTPLALRGLVMVMSSLPLVLLLPALPDPPLVASPESILRVLFLLLLDVDEGFVIISGSSTPTDAASASTSAL